MKDVNWPSRAYEVMPGLKSELRPLADQYANSSKGVVKKAAAKLIKALQKS